MAGSKPFLKVKESGQNRGSTKVFRGMVFAKATRSTFRSNTTESTYKHEGSMASMKQGLRAAQRQGVQTAPMRMGPKGGKFYINANGHKVYGEPPKGHAPTAVEAAKAPAKGRLPVPPHIGKGAHVQVDLEGEGWLHGTVHRVNEKNGTVRVKLHDGSGLVDAPFEATRTPKLGKEPKIPKAPPVRPGVIPPHIAVGKHVEADLEGEGWIKGKVTHVSKGHAHVALIDGTTAKVPHAAIRPSEEAKFGEKAGIERYATHGIHGNPQFKYQVARAVQEGGFAPFLEKNPLMFIREGGNPRNTLGVYQRSAWTLGDPRINIKADMSKQASIARSRSPELSEIGPRNDLVSVSKPHQTTADDLHHATLIHEISHHLHLHNAADKYGARVEPQERQLYDNIFEHYRSKRMNHGWSASKYALANEREWFAESHTAYVLHKSEFKKNDPEGYELIRKWRMMKGMNP